MAFTAAGKVTLTAGKLKIETHPSIQSQDPLGVLEKAFSLERAFETIPR